MRLIGAQRTNMIRLNQLSYIDSKSLRAPLPPRVRHSSLPPYPQDPSPFSGALIAASKEGEVEVVKNLIACGANVEEKDDEVRAREGYAPNVLTGVEQGEV